MKSFEVVRFETKDWSILSENAHAAVFNCQRPKDWDRISYAIACVNPDYIFSFATIIEMDKETAYMQHGGGMPTIQGSIKIKRMYRAMLEYLKALYPRITTRVHHKNLPMIKLALSEGLIINGIDHHSDGAYLHLMWERGNE